MATFDLIPPEVADPMTDFIDSTFEDFENHNSVYLSESAYSVGYDRTNPIITLFMPILVMIIVFTSLLLTKLLSFIGQRFKTIYLKLKKKIFHNMLIRFFTEEYITLTLACLIKVYATDFSNFYEGGNTVFAYCILILTVLFPMIASVKLWKLHKRDWEVMNQDAFKAKWGALTLDLRVNDKFALLQTLAFMSRRWILAFIIVGLPRWNWLQVQTIMNLNVSSLIYIGWYRPFSQPEISNKEVVNEAFI